MGQDGGKYVSIDDDSGDGGNKYDGLNILIPGKKYEVLNVGS